MELNDKLREGLANLLMEELGTLSYIYSQEAATNAQTIISNQVCPKIIAHVLSVLARATPEELLLTDEEIVILKNHVYCASRLTHRYVVEVAKKTAKAQHDADVKYWQEYAEN